MKKHICKQLVMSICIGILIFVGAGCSKKNVIPPDSGTGANQSGMNGGTDINYPNAEGIYSEGNLSSEGTLDDSTAAAGQDTGSGQQSFEYNKMHGRSTVGMEPVELLSKVNQEKAAAQKDQLLQEQRLANEQKAKEQAQQVAEYKRLAQVALIEKTANYSFIKRTIARHKIETAIGAGLVLAIILTLTFTVGIPQIQRQQVEAAAQQEAQQKAQQKAQEEAQQAQQAHHAFERAASQSHCNR